jgi:sec-independent protein translocase protein TatA
MFAATSDLLMLATFIGGWEVVLILVALLILIGAKRLPDIAKGLGEGLSQFRKATDEVAHNAGESLGGIYGKPAAEALTPDNQTAELYDPAAFRARDAKRSRTKRGWFVRCVRFWLSFWRRVVRLLKAKR